MVGKVYADAPLPRSVSMVDKYSSLNKGMEKVKSLSRCCSSPAVLDEEVYESRNTRWDIDDGIIGQVPPYYPLEKNHVAFHKMEASSVAHRIAECLQKMSIVATFDKANVKAETLDHIKFTINLFRKDTSLIVEVSRRKGCPIKFSRCRSAILQAINGNEYKRINEKERKGFSPKKTHLGNMENDFSCYLKNVYDLLKKDRMDANLLGMESLEMATDPSLNYEVALIAAKFVVCNHEEIQFKKVMMSLMGDWQEKCKSGDEFEREYDYSMHSHALTIMANSLSLLPVNFLTQAVESDSWLNNELPKLLMEELRDSKTRTHDAYISAKCLNALLKIPNMPNAMRKRGAPFVVKSSLFVGKDGHELLAMESDRILKKLKVQ